ncbi:MAG: FAD-binding oxidoreductase [bacterium]|nr:FAD-binding oxidoreductase [bacterium]
MSGIKALPGEIKKLSEALGPEKVILDRDILEPYSRDETSDLESFPEILVRAETADDVSAVLSICNESNIPVTPRGAGSGVTGGAVPVCHGVVLSLEKMNRIIEIDKENMVAVVEPGAITGDIQKAALDEGLMYPPDPASLDICSIGGNVAEGAGGPKAVKYGTTRDYILGLEFVLPNGSIIHTGGKIVKNATGYNLIGMLVGSEGTLAVITKIYLRLVPAPAITKDLLIPFDSLEAAIDTVFLVLSSRIVPSTIEFMEEDAIKLVAKHQGGNIPFPEARAHLLIQVEGNSDEYVYAEMEKLSEIIPVDTEKIIVAESALQREGLWKARRGIRESIHQESPVFLAEDCVVPRSKIPQFLKELKQYLKSKNLRSVMFGHAGDGNVHIDVLKGEMVYEDWQRIIPELKREIYKRALSLGGTITGEHGIGFTRKDYLSVALSDDEIELLKRIKHAFDPNLILNPEKIF